MRSKGSLGYGELTTLGKVIVYGLLLFGLFLFIFPLFWMVSTSLKPIADVYKVPPVWISWPLRWENYSKIFKNTLFVKYIMNTILYASGTILITVLSSSLTAFGFARLRARGSNLLFLLVLGTMMVPPQVTMIPQYLLFNKLGWIDSYFPLVMPAIGGSAFLIFLLRQFYLGIPKELDEAVKIDGGGYATIYFHIILPLSIPALGAAAIIEFSYRWNDLFGPLIYLYSQEKYPLALGLATYTASYGGTPWHELMAASVLGIIIPIVIFFFAQKYFLQGIVIHGTKG